ncbi:MAG: serine O-acetyltransferase, partial [Pseudomonadota bacterium]
MSSQTSTADAQVFPVAVDTIWSRMRLEAATAAASEPVLASFLNASVLHHSTFAAALSYRLAEKLADSQMSAMLWREVATDAFADNTSIVSSAVADINAYFERDPACRDYSQPFLYFKGFHTLQSHRVANWLWGQGRHSLALYLQSRMSEL